MVAYLVVLEDLTLQQKMLDLQTFGAARLTHSVKKYLGKTFPRLRYILTYKVYQILNLLIFCLEDFLVKIYQMRRHGIQMENSELVVLMVNEVAYGVNSHESLKASNLNM